MNSTTQKLELIQWIASLEDTSLLHYLRSIKEQHPVKVSNAEMASIERGLEDIAQGKVHAHATVRKRYEKWV